MNGIYRGESQIRSSSGRSGGALCAADNMGPAQVSTDSTRVGAGVFGGSGFHGERLNTFAGGDDGGHHRRHAAMTEIRRKVIRDSCPFSGRVAVLVPPIAPLDVLL